MVKQSLEEIFGETKMNDLDPSATPGKQSLEDIFGGEPSTVASSLGNVPSLADAPKPSPLGIMDRLKLSFADDIGKENYLKQNFQVVQKLENGKFAVGDNINNLQPIDPEGVFNDVLGDLADVAGEIPVIAGQIAGGMLGTPAGPAGIIAGGAAGSGAGEAAKIGIGRSLGLREQSAMKEATDIAISTAFGAAGESLAIGTGIIGKGLKRVLAPKLTKALGKAAKTASMADGVAHESTRFAKGLAKTFNVLANVPEESTETVLRHGVEETLGNPANLNKRTVLQHIDTVINAVKGSQKELGKRVGVQKEAFERVTRELGEEIPVSDIAKFVVNEAQDLGIIDDFGKFVPSVNLANKKDVGPIRQLLHNIAELDKSVVKINPNKTISGKDALRVSKIFGDSFDSMSQNAQNIITQAMRGNDTIGLPGIRTSIRDTAKKVGLDEFANTMDNFSSFMSLKEQLTALKSFKPDKIESFIKRLENLGEWNKTVLNKLDNFVQTTGGKSFVKPIEQWNAAQDFVGAKPDLLRFGAIAGTLAAVTGFETRESKLGTLAGALLVGTPAGARTMLRAGSKAAIAPRALASLIGRQASKGVPARANSPILTQLMKLSKSNQSSSKK